MCYVDKEELMKKANVYFGNDEIGEKCKIIFEMFIDKLNKVYAEGYKKGFEAGQKSGDANDG